MPTSIAPCWLPIPGEPGYEASDRGDIRNARTGRVLRPAVMSRGYLKVSLGRKRQRLVHRLVAAAFHGPAPHAGDHVDHINFDRRDNRPGNLRWLAPAVNGVRWNGRDQGRNVWATPDTPPEELLGYEPAEPLNDHELAVLHQAWAG
jgi:hypothetical protein